MDGNGRWARERGRPRSEGHSEGGRAAKRVVAAAAELGLAYLSLYVFSTENWARAAEEVSYLMFLVRSNLRKEFDFYRQNGIRIVHSGDAAGLPAEIAAEIEAVSRETAAFRGLTLNLAINYGGRDEILRAARRARAAGDGELTRGVVPLPPRSAVGARSRPRHPHGRGEAAQQLPPVGIRLRGAILQCEAVAGLGQAGPRRRARRLLRAVAEIRRRRVNWKHFSIRILLVAVAFPVFGVLIFLLPHQSHLAFNLAVVAATALAAAEVAGLFAARRIRTSRRLAPILAATLPAAAYLEMRGHHPACRQWPVARRRPRHPPGGRDPVPVLAGAAHAARLRRLLGVHDDVPGPVIVLRRAAEQPPGSLPHDRLLPLPRVRQRHGSLLRGKPVGALDLPAPAREPAEKRGGLCRGYRRFVHRRVRLPPAAARISCASASGRRLPWPSARGSR